MLDAPDVEILDAKPAVATKAPPADSVPATAASDSADCQVFDFEHKVFKLKPCVFTKVPGESRIYTTLIIEGLVVRVPMSAIKKHFSILDGSKDDLLFAKVVKALQFVREVRPGDSIPTEVLDGRASWLVEPRFREIAQAKITVGLVDWLQGSSSRAMSATEILAMVEKPEIKQKVLTAFDEMAKALGLPPERKEDVVDLISQLAGELSYTEALREKFSGATRIMRQLRQLPTGARGGKQALEDAMRIRSLLRRPVDRLNQRFEELDANVGEVYPTLRDMQPRIDYIRKCRDELRQAYLVWEETLTLWEGVMPEDEEALDNAMRQTYRFAAHQFPQAAKW